MKPRLLVLTTVHHPDDVRIRAKLIEALLPEWNVTYACRAPGPCIANELVVKTLRGGRIARNIRALGVVLRGRFEVLSLHDPETLPVGLIAAWLRRKTVVFDVHENIPAQILTKDWLPRWSRNPIARIVRWLLHLAERSIEITLAETGYASLFLGEHPVFENLLPAGPLPKSEGLGIGIVYLGDITPSRGVLDLVRAIGIGLPGEALTLIGPCSSSVAEQIRSLAAEKGVPVEFMGRLPHDEALARVAMARVAVSPLQDIPNYRWSMPTKLLEYLAVGVPVIASDLPGTRQVVENREGVVLVPPGDVEQWAKAFRMVMDDEPIHEAARAQASLVEQERRFPVDAVRVFYRSLAE